ncbi:si:dkey-190l8.2 [Brachionichthys hirsutus]|uniref:si:dkey-190l8.2 n=1 Tax=Brachionichthys hirsutus TaxID=412623 RepID=UPI003604C47B
MSPLQLSAYWRLSLCIFFSAFFYFVDIFAAAIIASTCRHGNSTRNGTSRPSVERNHSWHKEGEEEGGGDDDPACGWTGLVPYGQTLFMVGMLLGSLVGGAISDRYGKRPLMLVCVFLGAASGLVPALLPQPVLFLVVRCLMGICCCCVNMCAFSLAVEWTPTPARLWPPAFLPFCFSLGMMFAALLAWLSPTVRWLHLSLALPQVTCLPLFVSIPESPSWLLAKRRMHVLDRYRGNSAEDKRHLDLLLDLAWPLSPPSPGGPALSDHAPFRHPTILLRLCIMSYLSAVTAMTYFGICLNIDSFGVGVYTAQFFSGLSEVPCLLVPLVRLGRRPISMLTLLLSGAACFLSLLLSRHNDVHLVLVLSLALLGKLCILAASFVFVLYGIELFPTVVRQRCLSIVNLCFRIGSLFNYLFKSTGQISLVAMVAYSSGPIIGCGLCLLLPETSCVPLPDSVEDCDSQPLTLIRSGLCGASNQTRTAKPPPAERDDTHTPDAQC